MSFENEDIGKQGEGRPVGDDTRKADLYVAVIHTEAQRIGDRPLHDRSRDTLRPVAFLRQEGVNHVQVQAACIGRYLVSGNGLLRLHARASCDEAALSRTCDRSD
ncbi:hypothetical protein chiPu_0033707 [Chiloscyllium punctatum]|uniref:Uncharacterized protein n=1 Tax=Chiloscyllium punctatum TaxID=137246 RepID=A0A401U3Z1_CHIPU|nr:hypothetical protein [Chiloscyllium punctatum]